MDIKSQTRGASRGRMADLAALIHVDRKVQERLLTLLSALLCSPLPLSSLSPSTLFPPLVFVSSLLGCSPTL